MIKVYLKQAWELLKQNKLFSMLYIVGTGLAIAMTMIMAVVYYVKIAPVYPEVNRMNTLYLSNSKFTQGSGNNTRTMQWAVSYKALQDWFYPVENALVVSAELHNDLSENSYIQPADRSGDFPVMVKLTDLAFSRYILSNSWKVVHSRHPTWQVAFPLLSLPMIWHAACSVRRKR